MSQKHVSTFLKRKCQIIPTSSQNDPQMTPEWPPRWPQDDLKMTPKWPKMIPTIIPFIIHHYSPSSFIIIHHHSSSSCIIIHPHASLFIYHHPSPPFTIIFRRVQGSPFNFYFIFLNRMNAIFGNWCLFGLGLGHVQIDTSSWKLRSCRHGHGGKIRTWS